MRLKTSGGNWASVSICTIEYAHNVLGTKEYPEAGQSMEFASKKSQKKPAKKVDNFVI
jgi:hypothetical protein